jgi:hypothetical protein
MYGYQPQPRSITRPLLSAGGAFALVFPQNLNGSDTTAPYSVIEFANPHSNGLPLWGASGGGVTVVRKIKVTSPSQTGYYAQFWWSQGDGAFNGTNGYWGMHPYPATLPANSATTHIWEIAIAAQDYIDSVGSSPPNQANAISVAYGTTFKQIMIVTRADANNKTLTFYPDATNTASPNFVQITVIVNNYGETAPPSPKVTIGDSPWFALFQHEQFGGVLDAIKIITPALSLADATSEANDFSRMVTSAGQSGIWWGKNGFNSVNDLTCSYGTGRSFTRNDASNVITTTARL